MWMGLTQSVEGKDGFSKEEGILLLDKSIENLCFSTFRLKISTSLSPESLACRTALLILELPAPAIMSQFLKINQSQSQYLFSQLDRQMQPFLGIQGRLALGPLQI